MTELGGAQISNLLETLPGIAQVLRSPVADAFVNVIRLASRSGEFSVADAEEILQYAVRRNLLGAEESDRVLAEVQEVIRRRGQRSDARAEAKRAKVKAKEKPKTKAAPKKVKAAPTKRVVAKAKAKPKAKPKAKAAAKKR